MCDPPPPSHPRGTIFNTCSCSRFFFHVLINIIACAHVSVCGRFFSLYHNAVSSRVKELAFEDLEANEIVSLLTWVLNTYKRYFYLPCLCQDLFLLIICKKKKNPLEHLFTTDTESNCKKKNPYILVNCCFLNSIFPRKKNTPAFV